ncbi:MAG: hypothetical protein EOR63_32670 [Mesorhizobium sp.]|nr:MAG: hypothetical protein EOR63_32670 [Mesorhizobium sp.]
MVGEARVRRYGDAAALAFLCDPASAGPADEAKAKRFASRVRLGSFQARLVEAISGPDSRRTCSPVALLGGSHEAEAIFRGLGEAAGRDRWPILSWLRAAASRDGAATAVAYGRDCRPAGFVSCRRVVAVEVGGKDSFSLCYSVRPDYVYVAPDRRGMGHSTAMRQAFARAIARDIDALALLWEAGTLSEVGDISLGFEVMGIADSEEGELFMERLRQDMEQAVEARFPPSVLAGFGYESVVPAF